MVKRKQIEELYYIRAIAALGILIIHGTGVFAVNSTFNSKAMYLGIFFNQFFRFGSPVFMMISGLVLFYNYRSREEFNVKKFYTKKVLYILIPYIIWSSIYFLYRCYISGISFSINQIPILFKEIIFGTAFPHLYFIVLIFQFYIILPLLIRYLTKPMQENPIKLFFITFILQAMILIYGRYFKNYNTAGIVGYFNLYYWKSIFGWFFYFIAGGILGLNYEKIENYIERNIKLLFIVYIGVMCVYVGQVYYNIFLNGGRDYYDNFGSIRPETMIYTLATMPILMWVTKRMVGKFNIIKTFGTYSLGIYFAHPIVLEEIKYKIFSKFPAALGYSRLSSLLILVFLGIIFTFLLVLLIATLKNRWLLLGRIPKFNIKLRRNTTLVNIND
ncbi:acyltransferase [Tissierella pigra]|uniref:Acyltransferase n=1 Tax=Tissierella pigra TaxID=2607614 RepID=A0A6N7XJK3_9FIRM|nr:acyltransferase [Tissierella pigra]MBU5427405.1 acyltransferase [Tissierella pigra]MSU00952.1 acyltransferase [Tissierella pigra]